MTGIENAPPITAAEPPARSAGPLGPIREGERLGNLDVLRGVAICGILFVNMQFFAMTLRAAVIDLSGLADGPVSEEAAWAFVKIFCEFKFISMFSLLFGAGLIVQMTRAEAKGVPFVPVYLRRLGLLLLFGLVHALGLWYGDILFLYAWVGLVVLFARSWSPRTLLIVAVCLISFTTLLGVLFNSLQIIGGQFAPPDPAAAAVVEADPSAETPLDAGEVVSDVVDDAETPDDAEAAATDPEAPIEPKVFRGWEAVTSAQFDPTRPVWEEAETLAYQEGPLSSALIFRSLTWAYAMIGGVFGYGWRVAGMFLIGAALIKLGFFTAAGAAWQRRFMIVGLGVGLPMEVAASAIWIAIGHEFTWWHLAAVPLHDLGSFALCLGYVGLVCRLVGEGPVPMWLRGFSAVGRIALTTYLMETIITTSIMYWWGLGLFGTVSRVEQIGLTVAIYAGLVVFSLLWLRVFTIGPFEWLWRSLTYLRPQPILRTRRLADVSEVDR